MNEITLSERRSPIVTNAGGKVLADSRDVAAFFDKRHDHVLRDIEKIASDLGASHSGLFQLTDYADSYGRSQKAYAMNRDGFTLLAMGFTGSKALKWKMDYIAAFNAMEAQLSKLKPVTTQFDMMRAVIDNMEATNQRLFSVEKKVESLGAHEDFKSIKAYAAIIGRKITTKESGEFGKQATALSKQQGQKIGRQPDEAFGFVNTYHREILKQVFRLAEAA